MAVGDSRVLLISGSLRRRSTNTAMLRSAQAVAPAGIDAALFEGLAGLPHFNPDHDADPLPRPVADLRDRVHAADALLLSVPEYAGAMPGSFKNLLDWLIGDDQPGSIAGKPVAWITTSPRGASHAVDSLRKVLGHAGAAVVESACVDVPVTASMVGADGLVADPATLARLVEVLVAVAGAGTATGRRGAPRRG